MSLTRRLFLRQTAAVGATVTVGTAAVAEPIQPLTPDERIEAALAEITAAYREKWPTAPIRITDCDNGTDGMIIVVTHIPSDQPGEVHHKRVGAARPGGRRNG